MHVPAEQRTNVSVRPCPEIDVATAEAVEHDEHRLGAVAGVAGDRRDGVRAARGSQLLAAHELDRVRLVRPAVV
jgi:hypothetical protein